jgi:hypothetical protein
MTLFVSRSTQNSFGPVEAVLRQHMRDYVLSRMPLLLASLKIISALEFLPFRLGNSNGSYRSGNFQRGS